MVHVTHSWIFTERTFGDSRLSLLEIHGTPFSWRFKKLASKGYRLSIDTSKSIAVTPTASSVSLVGQGQYTFIIIISKRFYIVYQNQ